jgi:hypothetical protein
MELDEAPEEDETISAVAAPQAGGIQSIKLDIFYVPVQGWGEHLEVIGGNTPLFWQQVAKIREDLQELDAKPRPTDLVNFGKPLESSGGNVSTMTPRAQSGEAVVTGGVAYCDDCSGPIDGFESNGKTYTSQALYLSRQKSYGGGYCGKCLKKHPKIR